MKNAEHGKKPKRARYRRKRNWLTLPYSRFILMGFIEVLESTSKRNLCTGDDILSNTLDRPNRGGAKRIEKNDVGRMRPLTQSTCIRSMPGSGIVVVACAEPDMDGFVEALAATARAGDFASLALFFSPDYAAQTLALRLARDVPIAVQIGCSTAGEIGPFGIGK